MKKTRHKTKLLFLLSLLSIYSCSNSGNLIINDEDGVLSETRSPISVEVKLNEQMFTAAKEGRLVIADESHSESPENLTAVQLESSGGKVHPQLVLIVQGNLSGIHKYKLIEKESPFDVFVNANLDPETGQIKIDEAGKSVLQYNYQTVYEQDVVRLHLNDSDNPGFSGLSGIYLEEYLKENPEVRRDSDFTTSVYAIPRSDYIHPLYGLEGEMLTRDWPDGGHPHHRGIFWAWPEVEFGSQRGDIYALQRIFARPTGKLELTSGPVFAQIEAENLWMWEDTKPIVRENVIIRAYKKTEESRIIDLTIILNALEDSITVATRGTDSYGGLNLRMMTPDSQDISYFTDQQGEKPVRAWSDFNGIFTGSNTASGLMLLQHKDNPQYPGAWAEYPDLAWVQPTFPEPGSRYLLDKEKSLILRFRLIIHRGRTPDVEVSKKRWDAYNKTVPILNSIRQD